MLQGGNRAYSSTLGASGQRPSSASRVLDRPTVNKVPLCSGCEMVGTAWDGGSGYFRCGFRDVEVNKNGQRGVRIAYFNNPFVEKIKNLEEELEQCRKDCYEKETGKVKGMEMAPTPPTFARVKPSPKRKQTRPRGGG
eukprot:2776471-Rhodomonas_salina.1